MSAQNSSAQFPPPPPPPRKQRWLKAFWARVTEGLQVQELWGQFKSEARESYDLYSKDVDWEALKQERSRFKRAMHSGWAIFQAMLMKLTPARRVLLLLALAMLIFRPEYHAGHEDYGFDFGMFGAVILFVLLALELADRVTMKRDLEIAREIQQWLVPNAPPNIPGVDIAFATRPQNTVAGDYYDAFLRPESAAPGGTPRLLVAVADVAGKSVPAALLMATFQSGLRALSGTPATLEGIVTGLDRYARAHSLEGRRFTTAFLAEIDPATRKMRYRIAGTTIRFCAALRERSNASAPAARRWACRFSPTTKSYTPPPKYNSTPATCYLFLPMAWSKRSTSAARNSKRFGCSARSNPPRSKPPRRCSRV